MKRVVWNSAWSYLLRHCNDNGGPDRFIVRPGGCLNPLQNSRGFTLLELMLATAIATLVVAILAVSLTFSIQAWERQRGDKQSAGPWIIALMKYQLACFDPQTVTFDGTPKVIFQGNSDSLALATDYSVKALFQGVPVVARYIYEPHAKKLYYAEIPLDPYHPEAIRNFLQMSPNQGDARPRFYSIKMADFSLSYQMPESTKFTATLNSDKDIPRTMLLKWRSEDNHLRTDEIVPGFLFPLTPEGSSKTTLNRKGQ